MAIRYHGEIYLYNRYSVFNANDWLNNNAGLITSGSTAGQPVAPRPETSYWYPGAQIGGPVVFPWTKFNREHHKMFFFVARRLIDRTLTTVSTELWFRRKRCGTGFSTS